MHFIHYLDDFGANRVEHHTVTPAWVAKNIPCLLVHGLNLMQFWCLFAVSMYLTLVFQAITPNAMVMLSRFKMHRRSPSPCRQVKIPFISFDLEQCWVSSHNSHQADLDGFWIFQHRHVGVFPTEWSTNQGHLKFIRQPLQPPYDYDSLSLYLSMTLF